MSSRDSDGAFGRLQAFYSATFAVLGVYMQFFPVWLHDVGRLTKEQVTWVQSGQIWARTIAGPLWAQRVDKKGNARRALWLLSLLSLLVMPLFAVANGVSGLLVCCVVLGCLYPPMHPILDSLAVHTAHKHGFSYARVRAWGSISFFVVIVAVGALLDHVASHWILWIICGCLLMTVVASRFLPSSEPVEAPGSARKRAPIGALLSQPRVLLLLASCGLVQGSHGTYYTLSTLHWRANGISEGTAGLLWAEGIIAEIMLFYWARSWFDQRRPTTLIMLGALGAMVRWSVLAETVSIPWIVAINWLHAASFGLTYLGALRFVQLRIETGQRATAQGLVGAATSGLFMVLGVLLGGEVYASFEGRAFYAMAGMALLGGCLAMVLRRPAR